MNGDIIDSGLQNLLFQTQTLLSPNPFFANFRKKTFFAHKSEVGMVEMSNLVKYGLRYDVCRFLKLFLRTLKKDSENFFKGHPHHIASGHTARAD
jgi:hypothetical protein